jgi:AcrR family transcriptional regulator
MSGVVNSNVRGSAEPTSEMGQHIARVAARLFAERGFDATSVREIVEAAGVTKPTLYYYFRNKDSLAQALFSQPMARLVEQARSLLEQEGDLLEIAERFLNIFFDYCQEEPDRARFAFTLYFGPSAAGFAAEMLRCGQEMDALWLRLGERFGAAGWVEPARSRAFAETVHGIHFLTIMRYLYKEMTIEQDRARRILADALRGFGTTRGHSRLEQAT